MVNATPRRRSQSERVAESSQRLLRAAVELFAEQGFERTTAAEISQRAGYSHTMVHMRYGSKEALLESLLHNEYEALALPDLGPAVGVDRLQGWIDHIELQLRQNPELLRAFYVLIFESAGVVPNLTAWSEQWIKRCEKEASQTLTRGQKAGTIDPAVDPRDEAEQFVLAGIGLGFRWVFDQNTRAFTRSLDGWRKRFESHRIG